MEENSQPLAVLYGYRENRNQLNFIGRKGLINLSGRTKIIEKILRLCNGLNTVDKIVGQFSSTYRKEILELLSICETQGIIRDSRKLFIGFHEDSANPTIFSQDIGAKEVKSIMATQRLRERDGNTIQLPKPTNSHLLEIIGKRQSTRQFKKSRIPESKLSGLLQATYSIGKNRHWSVPSGGAMYPLDIYLIITNNEQTLPRGIYRWNPEKSEIITISGKNPNVWLEKVFNAKAILENAPCILCIAANLKRPALKYANRSYRNILLEAGHAAQNIYLFCAEQDIGVVEYVGFSEKILAREIGLQFPEESVIVTLILGAIDSSKEQSKTSDQEQVETAWQLRRILVGDSKPINQISFWEPEINGYSMPKWIGIAAYLPPCNGGSPAMIKRCSAFATGSTSSEATIKCLAEGFERYAWEQSRNELVESAVNLTGPFLDPNLVVPYAPIQRKVLKELIQFNPQEKIGWIAGTRVLSNERIWVPSELVFSSAKGLKRRDKLFYHSTSNGVAAHFDKKRAIESALYELIERDAFSVTWYAKHHVRAISHSCFPDDVQERISQWESFGYKVSILDLTIDGPPVILVIIWSPNKTPGLVSGAGCRSTFLDAANKAFDEAEFMAVTWHHRKIRHNMKMGDVRSPDDHGLFYVNPQNLIHAKWLLESEQSKTPVADFSGNLYRFDPIMVDITPKEYACGLSVVRVLSEKLMPINFGYGTEHYRHPRTEELGLIWSQKYPAAPHFFA